MFFTRYAQMQLFKFAISVERKYPELYDELMNMETLTEVADKINKLEDINIVQGTPFSEIAEIIEKMNNG